MSLSFLHVGWALPTILLSVLVAPALSSAAPATQPLVASVVPAATDLIISMGAGDHLVGISNFDDTSRPELKHLPKIGDYQTIDWERLRVLKPQILIIFQSPDRVSPGLKERAAKLNIKLVNIRTETLSDLFTELKNLGQLLNETEKAAAAAKKFDTQLQSMRQRLRNLPPVKTLILRDESATATVGRGNFLNDILELAGGQNVIEDTGWPTIDRERLASLNPDAIIVLLSNVSPQVEKQAAAAIARLPNVNAVKNHRIKIINLWYAQQPGLHLADLADQFADFLHPQKGAAISPDKFNRRDTEAQRGNDCSIGFLRASDFLSLSGCAPATWTVWLGCEGRAPDGQRAPSRASPFTSCPLSPPFLPAIVLKIIPPVSRRRRRYLNGFQGVAGGLYSAPMHLRIHSNIDPSTSRNSQTLRLPSPSPSQLSKTLPTHSPKLF